MWIRKGLVYVSEAEATVGDLKYSTAMRLNPVSYWLIRWVHGRAKLWELSAQAYLNREMRMELFMDRG